MRFLGKVKISQLVQVDREKLEETITLAEILIAIGSLKPNKSPGLDGITGEFYKNFQDQLGPVLQKVYQDCLEKNKVPST